MDDAKPLAAEEPPTGPLSPEPPAPPPPAPPVSEAGPLNWGITSQDSPSPPTDPYQPSVSTPAATPEMPIPPQSKETLVIPPATSNVNPFIMPETAPAGQPAGKPPPAHGNSFVKRFIIILLIFLVLAGIGVGIKYVFGIMGGAKEVTITYWGLWEDSPTLQAAIAEFQTVNPKIKVTYVKQSLRQYRERLQAAIARGDDSDAAD